MNLSIVAGIPNLSSAASKDLVNILVISGAWSCRQLDKCHQHVHCHPASEAFKRNVQFGVWFRASFNQSDST